MLESWRGISRFVSEDFLPFLPQKCLLLYALKGKCLNNSRDLARKKFRLVFKRSCQFLAPNLEVSAARPWAALQAEQSPALGG